MNGYPSVINTIAEEEDDVFLSSNSTGMEGTVPTGMGAVGQTLVWMTQQMQVMAMWREIVSPEISHDDFIQRDANPLKQRRVFCYLMLSRYHPYNHNY